MLLNPHDEGHFRSLSEEASFVACLLLVHLVGIMRIG